MTRNQQPTGFMYKKLWAYIFYSICTFWYNSASQGVSVALDLLSSRSHACVVAERMSCVLFKSWQQWVAPVCPQVSAESSFSSVKMWLEWNEASVDECCEDWFVIDLSHSWLVSVWDQIFTFVFLYRDFLSAIYSSFIANLRFALHTIATYPTSESSPLETMHSCSLFCSVVELLELHPFCVACLYFMSRSSR